MVRKNETKVGRCESTDKSNSPQQSDWDGEQDVHWECHFDDKGGVILVGTVKTGPGDDDWVTQYVFPMREYHLIGLRDHLDETVFVRFGPSD